MSMDPVLILCQGRSGGTWFADEIASLIPNSTLWLEPLNVVSQIQKVMNWQKTDPMLRHDVRPYPLLDYVDLDLDVFKLLTDDERIKYILDNAKGTPVIKVSRFAGHAAQLVKAMGEHRTVIHFWRDAKDQTASRM
ncbi:hypothetical protein LCGC14_1723440, partial [marine sediment metagenome]